MKHVKLDRIDLRILRELQKDGRMTNVDLAVQVGISAPPCLRRVRALEEAGYIRSYHADLDPIKLGYKELRLIFVKVNSHAADDLDAFDALVKSWPEVRECYRIYGIEDFMLKVVSRDLQHYNEFYDHLSRAPNFGGGRTLEIQLQTKCEPGVPLDDRCNGAATAIVKKDDAPSA